MEGSDLIASARNNFEDSLNKIFSNRLGNIRVIYKPEIQRNDPALSNPFQNTPSTQASSGERVERVAVRTAVMSRLATAGNAGKMPALPGTADD